MCDEWGPVIRHDGKGCPVPVGTVVRVRLETDPGCFVEVIDTVERAGSAWFWKNWLLPFADGSLCGRVVSYQMKRPRALRMLCEIAADPGETGPRESGPLVPDLVSA